ncbi:hypothetical protein V1514DRAFT_301676 [Lipomyces japonicus]|uniref:uncharacterized protein n=1 Tax=Lipomyces japonicus TaxID=56871 RepID=UPI0034CF1262
MDSSSVFATIPLRSSRSFSWIFLVELIVVAVAVIFVLFYFNRVIGTILSLSLRWYTWHKYRVFVDARAIQVSLLGGRVFFKDLRYIGSNEAVFAVQGHFTWKYWLSRTRQSDIHTTDSKKLINTSLSPRFQLYVEGLEWFVYNRIPAYEEALKTHSASTQSQTSSSHTSDDEDGYGKNEKNLNSNHLDSDETVDLSDDGSPKVNDSNSDPATEVVVETQLSHLLKLLPIEVICKKGSMVLGNVRTPTIMIYYFESATGSVDTHRSRSTLDKYKMVYDFKFNHPNIQIKANMDYKEPTDQYDNDNRFEAEVDLNKMYKPSKWQSILDMLAVLIGRYGLSSNAKSGQSNTILGDSRWHGLPRYTNGDEQKELGDEDDHVEEYAKVTSVFDAVQAQIKFYYDVAGNVPQQPRPLSNTKEDDQLDIGNGGPPPEFGVDLTFNGATIQYGPWADRQRILLHSMFAPSAYKDRIPQPRLVIGEERQSTEFKVYIELDSSCLLRIPIREPSRDVDYKKLKKESGKASVRSFGWVEFKLAQLSTITVSVQLLPSKNGWCNKLACDFNMCEIRSSINHDLLLTATSHKVSAELSAPLEWNGLQTWTFNNICHGSKIFLLREHVTIFSDMVSDFAYGPAVQYAAFIPRRCLINLEFDDFSLFLNVNDSNIISNPTDFDDNIFLDFSGPKLDVNIDIPMDQIMPTLNEVKFDLNAPVLDLCLHAPPWNTYACFIPSSQLGGINSFELTGSYTYVASSKSELIDTLIISIHTEQIALITYGFLIRYLIIIRENYFGDHVLFKTLDEFTKGTNYDGQWNKYSASDSASSFVSSFSQNESMEKIKPTTNVSNIETATDVQVNFSLGQGTLILPVNIYSPCNHLRLDLDMLDANLRFTNYYMDLQMNISPLHGEVMHLPVEKVLSVGKKLVNKLNPQIFIDGFTIFGHRMFGLPPSEPTYICNWDFDIGLLFVEGDPTLVQDICGAVIAFSFTLEDKENALIVEEPPLYDVTLFTLKLPSIRLLIHTESATFEFMTDQIFLSFSDLCNSSYSAKLSLKIPKINFLCFDRWRAESNNHTKSEYQAYIYIETSLYLANFDTKKDAAERIKLQQNHIRKHDRPFGRAQLFLISDYDDNSLVDDDLATVPAVIPVPAMPLPLVYSKVNQWSQGYGMSMTANSSAVSLSSVIHHDLRQFSNEKNVVLTYLDRYELFCKNALNENEEFSSEFLPPFSCIAAFKLMDHVKNGFEKDVYDKDESSPSSEIPGSQVTGDNDTQYDSFVIELRDGINGFVSPVGLEKLSEVLDAISKPSTDNMMDDLQLDIMARLESNLQIVHKVTNWRLVVPGVHMKYGTIVNRLCDNSLIPDKIQFTHHFDLEVRNLSLNIRMNDKSLHPHVEELHLFQRNPVKRVSSVYASLFQASLALVRVNKGTHDDQPLKFSMENFEAWNRSKVTSVGSLRVKSVSLVFESENLCWSISTLIDNAGLLKPVSRKMSKIEDRRTFRRKNLIYLVVIASSADYIAHDPAFLTRPAYVLRSSKSHIRANDSWKLMSRIRHIMRSLPIAVIDGINNDLSVDGLHPPLDAKERVIQGLKDWRSWEMLDISQSFILSHVFDGEPKVLTPAVSIVQFLVEMETATLYHANGTEHEDYIQLSYPSFSISSDLSTTSFAVETKSGLTPFSTSETVEQQRGVRKINHVFCSFSCEEIRLIVNWNLLSLYKKVETLLQEKGKATRQQPSVLKTDFVQSSDQSAIIDCHIILSIKSFLTVMASKNLQIISSGHNIDSSLILFISDKNDEYLIKNAKPSSLLIRSGALEIDLVSTSALGERQLLTTGIQDSEVSFTVDCLAKISEVKSSIRINELIFDLMEDSEKLCTDMRDFINYEMTEFDKMFLSKADTEIAATTKSTTSHKLQSLTTVSNLRSPIKVDISVDLRSYRLNLVLLPSLMYFIHGRSVQIISTPVINQIRALMFEAGEQVHEFKRRSRGRESAITAIDFPKISAIVRIEDMDHATRLMDARINVHAMSFDAFSFPDLARALAGDVTKSEVKRAKVEWLSTVQLFDSHFSKASVRTGANLKNFTFHGSLFISSVTLKLESGDSHMIISVSKIKSEGTLSLLHKQQKRSLFGSLPSISMVVRNKRFRGDEFTVLSTDLLFSIKHDMNGAKSSNRSSFTVKSKHCRMQLSPLSSTLIVDILSKFEEQVTSIELPEELLHFRYKHKELMASDSDEKLDKTNALVSFFKSLLRVQFKKLSFGWISDEFGDNSTNGNFAIILKLDKLSLNSKGESSIQISIQHFVTWVVQKSELYKLDSKASGCTSMISEIEIKVSIIDINYKITLGLGIRSEEVMITLYASAVNVINGVMQSALKTADVVSEKREDYRRRVSRSNIVSKPIIEEAHPLFFNSANVKAQFAGATIELIGSTNEKYTEEPFFARSKAFVSKAEVEGAKKNEPTTVVVATLRVPGVHFLMDYLVTASRVATLSAEILIESSTNKLFPRVVPVVMEMVKSFQATIREPKNNKSVESKDGDMPKELPPMTSDAINVLENLTFNIGLRVARQEFTLSCHPIARVAATAVYDEFYVTVNAFHPPSSPRYFSMSAQLSNLRASLQHIYSRESSGQIVIKDMTIGALSHKKLSRESGLSCVGRVADVQMDLNMKQSHDLLLFQDIWSPNMILEATDPQTRANDRAEILVERYHRVASTNAFPWNVDFELLNVKGNVDLGQALGKLTFGLDKMWLASRKSSDWEQILTFGLGDINIDCNGRLGGQLNVSDVKVRSAIRWQVLDNGQPGIPLVHLSVCIDDMSSKLYFDYKMFFIFSMTALQATLFNQRQELLENPDRLIGIGDCEAVKLYLTVLAPSNLLAILNAIERLQEERAVSYQAVLRDSDRFKGFELQKESVVVSDALKAGKTRSIGLRTELGVSIRTVIINIFPSMLSDAEVLRLETSNVQARFGIDTENNKIRSRLKLLLGQFLVALSTTKSLKDHDLNAVPIPVFVQNASEAKGGIIMRIPAVSVYMKTWQPVDNQSTVEFIFKSTFDGRVEVGWNLGSINFIRDMWNTHVRSFQMRKVAAADGKSLVPQLLESEELEKRLKDVKLSKDFTYIPLELPVLPTPQLRDMGEATPPLEWIGLNRDRFPGLTHQFLITALQEMSQSVELAYDKVLGKA